MVGRSVGFGLCNEERNIRKCLFHSERLVEEGREEGEAMEKTVR